MFVQKTKNVHYYFRIFVHLCIDIYRKEETTWNTNGTGQDNSAGYSPANIRDIRGSIQQVQLWF